MNLSVSQQWKTFSRGKPGHRFQDRYRSHRRKGEGRNMLRLLVHLALAIVCLAIGVVLAFIPGPAIVFFLLAGALLASEWLWVARILDWMEVKLRIVWKHARAKWRQLPVAGRVALIAAGCCLTAITTYGAYRMMM